eukprot:g32179.t1
MLSQSYQDPNETLPLRPSKEVCLSDSDEDKASDSDTQPRSRYRCSNRCLNRCSASVSFYRSTISLIVSISLLLLSILALTVASDLQHSTVLNSLFLSAEQPTPTTSPALGLAEDDVPVRVLTPKAKLVPPPRVDFSTGKGEITMGVYRLDVGPACSLYLRGWDNGTEPAIYAKQGTTIRLTLRNTLQPHTEYDHQTPHNSPRLFNSTNVHTHGLHVSSVPPADDIFIHLEGGNSYDYVFPVDTDQSPGTNWYHSHRHGAANLQVMSGAVGLLVIEDDDRFPEWLRTMPEIPFLVRAIQLKLLNESSRANEGHPDPLWERSETAGCPAVIPLVNGQSLPVIPMQASRWHRFRVVAAGPHNHLALVIDPSCQVYIMSLDGIHVDTPISMTHNGKNHVVFLASGNRRELAIKCHLQPGQTEAIVPISSTAEFGCDPPHKKTTHPCSPHRPEKAFGDYGDTLDTVLAYFHITDPAESEKEISIGPDNGEWLSGPTYPYLQTLIGATVDGNRTVAAWTPVQKINGKSFPKSAQHQPVEWIYPLNKVSEIELQSEQAGSHPFHHHIVPFQVQASRGINFTAVYGFDLVGHWMDTIMVPEDAVIIVRQRPDLPGFQIVHCHMLKHEDAGMMLLAHVQ